MEIEITEAQLEQIIMDLSKDELYSLGIDYFLKKKSNQFNLGNYGRIDIINWEESDGIIYLNIIELKKNDIDNSTFIQSIKYLKGIVEYIKYHKIPNKVRIDITLIGKKVNKLHDLIYLENLISFINISKDIHFNNFHVYEYNFNHKGISFKKESNYDLIKNGFTKEYLGLNAPF